MLRVHPKGNLQALEVPPTRAIQHFMLYGLHVMSIGVRLITAVNNGSCTCGSHRQLATFYHVSPSECAQHGLAACAWQQKQCCIIPHILQDSTGKSVALPRITGS